MQDETWINSIRSDFPVLNKLHNPVPPVYFDNACTSLVPVQVIKAMNDYYIYYPGCSGTRSRHLFADKITFGIEGNPDTGFPGSRKLIQEFINARSSQEIIFSLNTSYAINLVALGLNFHPGDVVLLGDKEHNSNLIPWLRLQNQGLVKVVQAESDQNGFFDPDSFKKLLENNPVKLVSLGFTSNVTGETLNARELIHLAHLYSALVLLDAAQTIPHQSIDVQALDVDLMAFSLHKMCGPKGIGILYCKRELLEENQIIDAENLINPVILGGGSILDSTCDSYSLLGSPERFEVGVQNYAGQIAAGEAVNYLNKIGFARIKAQENTLNKYLTGQLLDKYGQTGWFKILGPADSDLRGGILTFEIHRPNAVGVAEELSQKNKIMIRDGVFCVHSYFNKLYGQHWLSPSLPEHQRMIYRVSLYFYNTFEECRIFLDALDSVFKDRSYI
jgi:cysteine desulfurase / selenocysteine lyase